MSTERLFGECPACIAERVVPTKGTAFVLGCYITHQLSEGVAVILCDKHDFDWKEIAESKNFDNKIVLISPSQKKGSVS